MRGEPGVGLMCQIACTADAIKGVDLYKQLGGGHGS